MQNGDFFYLCIFTKLTSMITYLFAGGERDNFFGLEQTVQQPQHQQQYNKNHICDHKIHCFTHGSVVFFSRRNIFVFISFLFSKQIQTVWFCYIMQVYQLTNLVPYYFKMETMCVLMFKFWIASFVSQLSLFVSFIRFLCTKFRNILKSLS